MGNCLSPILSINSEKTNEVLGSFVEGYEFTSNLKLDEDVKIDLQIINKIKSYQNQDNEVMFKDNDDVYNVELANKDQNNIDYNKKKSY